MEAKTSPGRLLRLTLQVYRNQNSTIEEREKFARAYVAKAAALHAKNGMEMYQQVSGHTGKNPHNGANQRKVYTPVGYRGALDEMNRRSSRGWTIDVSLPGMPPKLRSPIDNPLLGPRRHRGVLLPQLCRAEQGELGPRIPRAAGLRGTVCQPRPHRGHFGLGREVRGWRQGGQHWRGWEVDLSALVGAQ